MIAEPLTAMWENAALGGNVLEVPNNAVEMVEAVDDCKSKLDKVLKTVRKIDEAIKLEPVLEKSEETVKAVQKVEQNVERVIQAAVTTAVQNEWRKVPATKKKPRANIKNDGEGKIKVVVDSKDKKKTAAVEIQEKLKKTFIKRNKNSVGVKRIFLTLTDRLMLFMNSRREADSMKQFIDKELPEMIAEVTVTAVPKVVLATRHKNVRGRCGNCSDDSSWSDGLHYGKRTKKQ